MAQKNRIAKEAKNAKPAPRIESKADLIEPIDYSFMDFLAFEGIMTSI
jgi:hypothetical protein